MISKQVSKITINHSVIGFNKPAEKQLALQNGSKFCFEFEDGNLYYKESNENNAFCIISTGRNGILVSRVTGIMEFIEQFFHKDISLYYFKVGELKNGRRILTMELKKSK